MIMSLKEKMKIVQSLDMRLRFGDIISNIASVVML